MKKRIITALLILTMAFSNFAAMAFAAAETPETTQAPQTTIALTAQPAAESAAQPVAECVLPLQKNSTGSMVIKLQKCLIANGYKLTASGAFDLATETALKQYQADLGRETTGIADAAIYERLVRIENFLSIAQSKIGCKYVSGGKGPSKFDCSGFVYWTLNQAGVKQSYMTSRVWPSCKKYRKITSMSKLLRGDVLCFKGHMAIYLGKGVMINASCSRHKVTTRADTLSLRYWKKNFRCAFRVF